MNSRKSSQLPLTVSANSASAIHVERIACKIQVMALWNSANANVNKTLIRILYAGYHCSTAPVLDSSFMPWWILHLSALCRLPSAAFFWSFSLSCSPWMCGLWGVFLFVTCCWAWLWASLRTAYRLRFPKASESAEDSFLTSSLQN